MCTPLLLAAQTTNVWPNMLLVLLLLALMAAGSWALVRFRVVNTGRKNTGRMRIVERLSLEQRKSIYIVTVDEKEMLLGVCDTEISLLGRLEKEHTEEVAPHDQ